MVKSTKILIPLINWYKYLLCPLKKTYWILQLIRNCWIVLITSEIKIISGRGLKPLGGYYMKLWQNTKKKNPKSNRYISTEGYALITRSHFLREVGFLFFELKRRHSYGGETECRSFYLRSSLFSKIMPLFSY